MIKLNRNYEVKYMKYKGNQQELENFLSSKYKCDFERDKGNITLSATTSNGSIINWFKQTGTISLQGEKNEKLERELNSFVNGTVLDIYSNENINGSTQQKIYIVHGHDINSKEQLENILLKWGLEPIATMDQASCGGTIIETLTRDLNSCDYGIVLLTPDDYGYSAKEGSEAIKPRARQNVILELGILIGKLGRKKVLVARKSEIEEPSDIHGVLYKAFNESIKEIKEDIRKEFKAAGIELKND